MTNMRQRWILPVLLNALCLTITSCSRNAPPAEVEIKHGVVQGQPYSLELPEDAQSPYPGRTHLQKNSSSDSPVSQEQKQHIPDFIIVQSGEELYMISEKYHVPASKIILINKLQAPYTLQVGQTLYLKESAAPTKLTPVSTGNTDFIWPVQGRIISTYGEDDGVSNEGINIAAPKDTPIYAAKDGTVTYVGNETEFGNMALISHEDGWRSAYAHADRIVVENGEKVTQGQVIGYVGKTGNVTSPQLHFEIRNGKQSVDPSTLMSPMN